MTMRTIACIAALILLGIGPAGCGARNVSDPGSMSLMDRYNTGQDLFAKGADTPALLTSRADAALEAGQAEPALRLYDAALERDALHVEARLGKGLALLETGRARVALAQFAALLEDHPDHAGAHEGAGRACLAEGLPEPAAEHFRAALRSEPRRAACLRLLGAAHTALGEHAQAADAFLRASDAQGTDTEALADAGMSLALTGRHEEALSALMRVVRLGRPTERVYNNLGLVLYKLGRPHKALAAFTAAGGEAAAHNNLGWFLFQDGRYAEAVVSFTRAMEASPSYYVRAAENLKRARLAAGLQAAAPAPPVPAVPALPVTRAAHRPSENNPAVTPENGPRRPPAMNEYGPVFTVHVSSWQTRRNARLDASRLESRMDMEVYVFKVDLGDKGSWWRVTAGNYRTIGAARAAKALMRQAGLNDLRIIRRRQPGRDAAPATPGMNL